MKVKFAHLADCHLGAWRNEKLNQLGYLAFERAIDKIIAEKVDFVIISGDLFDVSNPKVDVIDLAVRELKKLKDNEIPTYGVMGSHDFSPSNKTMVRPLITAGLFIDVSKGKYLDDGTLRLKFTKDPKTNIKLVGLRARKRSLEIEDYRNLYRDNLEKELGIKIFILHTMLSELKPIEFKDMASAPKSLLPSNFHYYAGGHLHKTVPEELRKENYVEISNKTKVIYPGALSPTNFRELEQYKYGGFCIISGDIDSNAQKADFNVQFVPLKIKEVITIDFDCNNKSSLEVQTILKEKLENLNVEDKVVTVRIYGKLSSGKPYEIKINEILFILKENDAYEVLINKVALFSKEYTSIRVPIGKSNEEIENTLIHEHAQNINMKKVSKKDLENKIHNLLSIIGKEREEGTKVKEYENFLITNFKNVFQLSTEGKQSDY